MLLCDFWNSICGSAALVRLAMQLQPEKRFENEAETEEGFKTKYKFKGNLDVKKSFRVSARRSSHSHEKSKTYFFIIFSNGISTTHSEDRMF